MNTFYTHQPFLIEILQMMDTEKEINCLEFGVGDGSSSIFHDFAKKNKNMNIESFEHDISWFSTMKNKYSLSNYIFNLIEWENFDYSKYKQKIYDLVFVDQGVWDARIKTIDELIGNSKIIILHDYCYYNGMNPVENVLDKNSVGDGTFFHKKYNDIAKLIPECKTYPPTLILKNKLLI
jgi:hypothetical protein